MDSDWLSAHRRGVESAAATIVGHVRRTPVLEVDVAGPVLLKPECLQRTGSFKARGAFANLLLRQVPAAGGYLSQSSRTVHFGLGNRAKIDRVEIRWPSGARQQIDQPAINQLHSLTESKE